MKARLLFAAASAGLVLAGPDACRTTLPDAVVSRCEVTATVADDQSTRIEEHLTVRAEGNAPLAVFERQISADRADAIEFEEASLNGQRVAPGGALDVKGDATRLDVRWTLSADARESHDLVLRYRLQGALEIHDTHARLAWVAIPAPRRFNVLEARLRAVAPQTAFVFPLTGIDEAGWTVLGEPHGFSATREALPAAEPATMVLELSVPPRTSEPRWQVRADRNASLTPAFISGGLFMIVIGAGIVWIVRFQYPRQGSGLPDPGRAAVWAGLRAGGRVSIVVAAFCALAIRFFMPDFGPWPQALPVSMVIVGIALEIAGRWLR